MFAFPRSFFCWTRLLRCACFFVDDAPKERLYDSLLFFFFSLFSSSSSSPLLQQFVVVCYHHHHHQLQDDQINAVYTNSIVFFLLLFSSSSSSDDRARAVKPSLIYIYIYMSSVYMCFLVLIRNSWPQRSFLYSRAFTITIIFRSYTCYTQNNNDDDDYEKHKSRYVIVVLDSIKATKMHKISLTFFRFI